MDVSQNPQDQAPESQPHPSPPKSSMSGQETFNVVTDTVAGPNLRWKDNLFQALSALFCSLIGGVGLGLVFQTWVAAVGGIVGGMIAGILVSGIVLMIYRALRHLSGRHD